MIWPAIMSHLQWIFHHRKVLWQLLYFNSTFKDSWFNGLISSEFNKQIHVLFWNKYSKSVNCIIAAMQLISNTTYLFKSFCLSHKFLSKVYSLLNFHWYFVSQYDELTHLPHQSNQAWIIVYIHQLALVKLNDWFISYQAANMSTNLLIMLKNFEVEYSTSTLKMEAICSQYASPQCWQWIMMLQHHNNRLVCWCTLWIFSAHFFLNW